MVALAVPAISQAGSININVAGGTLNGTQQCTDSPSITMNPTGDLTVSCTPLVVGTTFTCSFASQVLPNTGGVATLAASCQNATGAVTINWTALGGAPAPDAATGTTVHVTLPANTGTSSVLYSYKIDASDSASTPNTSSFTGTVTVTPPGGTCSTTATYFTITGNQGSPPTPSISRTGYVAIALPIYTTAKSIIQLSAAEVTSQPVTSAQFVVSKCPGDFTFTNAACSRIALQSGLSLSPAASATPVSGKCTLDLNTQYYWNIRFVKTDLTPSCATSTCQIVLKYQSN
jgi:hypothetical protein